MRNRYQGQAKKSNGSTRLTTRGKFEVVVGPFGSAQGKRELAPMKSGLAPTVSGLAVRLPLPLAEMWEELRAEVERLTGATPFRQVIDRCRTKVRGCPMPRRRFMA